MAGEDPIRTSVVSVLQLRILTSNSSDYDGFICANIARREIWERISTRAAERLGLPVSCAEAPQMVCYPGGLRCVRLFLSRTLS